MLWPLCLNGGVQVGTTSFARSEISVLGRWLSEDAGEIELDWGFELNLREEDVTTSVGAYTNRAPEIDGLPANWFYDFKATANGSFTLNYDIRASGDTVYLQPLYLYVDDGAGGPLSLLSLGGSFEDPTGSGSVSISLLAGETYKLYLLNFTNLFTPEGSIITPPIVISAQATSLINWNISYVREVPEPAMPALIALGLLALSVRRRVSPSSRWLRELERAEPSLGGSGKLASFQSSEGVHH